MTRKRSAQTRKKQVEICVENEDLLSLFYSSKNEFSRDFKRCVGTPKAKEFYFHVLTKLKEAVLANKTDNFSKLLGLVDCASSLDPKIPSYSHESENPIKDASLVILACKHNRLEILKCLLHSGKKILNILSSGEPELIDSEKHNAFYYAIRAGNAKLLDILINEWPNKYFASNLGKLYDILAKAFAELKLKNVLLSDEVEIFLKSKLLDLRFYSNISCLNKCSQNNLDSLKERIKLVTENIDFLQRNYSNEEKVDDRFLFVAKFIAQNIHILKRQLKSTYDKLPWEEIEFCLICFVSSYIKQQEINLFYQTTLNIMKMMKYLENFAKQLNDKIDFLNCSVDELADLPQLSREQVITNILNQCPQFKELYCDYQKLRDVCSLEKIGEYSKLAMSANPQEREGQLIITRALQVIGEYLKNSLESPKLSETTNDLLLLSLSPNTKKVLSDLRNALSHSYALSKRMEFEENADLNYFTGMQKDLKRINNLVINILHRDKMKTIKEMLERLSEIESLDEIKSFAEIFRNVVLNPKSLENVEIEEHNRLEKLIKKLSKIVTDKTDYEKDLFKEINKILDSTRSQSKDIKSKYEFGLSQLESLVMQLNSGRTDKNFKQIRKTTIGQTIKLMTPDIEPDDIRKIGILAVKIIHSAGLRVYDEIPDELRSLGLEVFFISEFETHDLKWIEKLQRKLKGKTSIPIQKSNYTNEITRNKYKNKLKLKQQELQSILCNNGLDSPTTRNIKFIKKDKKLLLSVEMLVLDIMSLLETSKNGLDDNLFFLDEYFPLLTGKCLRNHLAHDNALIDLLPLDPVVAVVLNAQKLINMPKNGKIKKSVENSPFTPSVKLNQELLVISNQNLMFNALENEDLSGLKNCLQNGADIYARNSNLQTSPHFASMASNLDVIKYIHDLGINLNVQDIAGKTPLHIAAECGTQLMVEFLIEKAGLPVDCVDITGKTPLHFAAKNGHVEVVRTLLNNKAWALIEDFCHCIPVYYAIRHNHLDVVKILIKENFDVNEIIGGYTPLFVGAESGHLEVVEFLLQNKAGINVSNGKNRSPLHVATVHGHVEVVNALIRNGADINARAVEGCTPLHYAIENNHEQIAGILLQHGARVSIRVKLLGATPLLLAVRDRRNDISVALSKNGLEAATSLRCAVEERLLKLVEDLLERGEEINAKDSNGFTALHYAALNGYRKISELLIGHAAEVNVKNPDGATPLHIASLEGHQEVVDFLIAREADINAPTMIGDRPLHLAAIVGSIEVIDTLIKNKAEVNRRNSHGRTPLFFAARAGHEKTVVFLIKNKAEVNIESEDGCTPLYPAVLAGHKDVVKVLIENGAQINTFGKDSAPLSLAVEGGFEEIVELLLVNGADVNIKVKNRSPLLIAVTLNSKEMVEMLLANGADVNENNGELIEHAIFAGFKDIMEILVKHKAHTNVKSKTNNTLLHIAAQRGNKEIVHILLNEGIEVDATGDDKITALFIACQSGHYEAVKVLIAYKADVNVICAGATPLSIAARLGYDHIVEILLKNGAKIKMEDGENRTPIEVAVIYGQLEVVKLLLEHEVELKNFSDNDGNSLLHTASLENNLEMVKYLVSKGCHINVKNAFGSKPVHIAAEEGRKNIVEFFLSNGVSVNDVASDELTILHHAAMGDCFDVLKYLLDNGAAVNSKDTKGRTPIHIAAYKGFEATVKVLLEYGAFYNAVDQLNKKPLHVSNSRSVIELLESIEKLFSAVKRESPAEVEISLKKGAFVDAKNANYGTPLHYAAWKGNIEVMNILLQNGANPNSVYKKGFTPLHYAAKFSHLKAVLALLNASAIYNAVSDCGKTPLDFSSDKNIDRLLKLVNASFEKVQNGDSRIISNLNKVNDIETVKAVMKASNKENRTLVVAAIHCNFPKIDELKQVHQCDLDDELQKVVKFMNQGDCRTSLNILKSVFDKRKELLGLDNPGTLDIQWHIGQVLIQQGKYQESINTLENVCAKQITMLGKHHKDTLNTKSAMAVALLSQEKHEEAYSIFKEVYRKQKEILEPNHEDILSTQIHLTSVLEKLKKYEEALNLCDIVYQNTISNPVMSNNFLICVENVRGSILISQKKYEEALKVCRNNFEISKKTFGVDCRETIRALQQIAIILSHQKKNEEALRTHRTILDIQKNIFGPMYHDTFTTQYNIATILEMQGKQIEAMKICRDIFHPVKMVLGSEHPLFLNISKRIEDINFSLKLELGVGASEFLQHLQKNINTAANNGDIKTVELLVKNGINVNDKDIEGRSPLHFAISGGHTDIVNLLLECGADPTQVTNKGNTPLHTAVSAGRKEIVDILLQHVAQDKLSNFINIGTLTSETTSLHVAAKNGSLEIVKSLLKYGAIYNITNKGGKSPLELSQDENVSSFLKLTDDLFKATAKGNSEVISKLKALKSDEFAAVTNARNSQRNTLLLVASMNKHQKIAVQLLQLLKKVIKIH